MQIFYNFSCFFYIFLLSHATLLPTLLKRLRLKNTNYIWFFPHLFVPLHTKACELLKQI
jgi:hypothetical protein